MPSFIDCIHSHYKTLGLGKVYFCFANAKKMSLNEVVTKIRFLEFNDDLEDPTTFKQTIQVLTNIIHHIEAKTGWNRLIQFIKNFWNALNNHVNGYGFVSHVDRTKTLLKDLLQIEHERLEQQKREGERMGLILELEKQGETAPKKLQANFEELDEVFSEKKPLDLPSDLNDFLDEAEDYIALYGPFPPVAINHLPLNNPKQALEQFLRYFDGICFGESHASKKSKKFIIDHLDFMQKQGVDTLFLEGAYTYEQPGYDLYLEEGQLDPQIQNRWTQIDSRWNLFYPYSYRGLIDEAIKRGMRVVGYETNADALEGVFKKRFIHMNYAAFRVIQKEKGAGKWAALMGNAHFNTPHDDMPGIPALTKTPSISLRDSSSKVHTFYARQIPFEVDDHSFIADTMFFL
jgi:hypothetical protein